VSDLADLEAQIRRRLSLFEYPMRDWMLTDPATTHDVVILGTGQRALALALALQRERIHRVALVATDDPDLVCMQAEKTARPGAERCDFATHEFLFPPLSYQSWQTASGGSDWTAYLRWYQKFVAAPVLTDVADIAVPGWSGLRLADHGASLTARRLVITVGADNPIELERDPQEFATAGLLHAFATLPAKQRAALVAAMRGDGPAEDIPTTRYFELLTHDGVALPVHLFGTKALTGVGPAAMAAHLLRFGVPILLTGLSRSLFLQDQERLFEAFAGFETAEILGGKHLYHQT
jgi:hypothetical protein